MKLQDIYNISEKIFKIISYEYDGIDDVPNLFENIAFTRYNRGINLKPESAEAFFITLCVNNRIIKEFYNDFIFYDRGDQNLISEYYKNKK